MVMRPNISTIAPPSTGAGMVVKIRPTTGNSPSSTRMTAMYLPTWREATPVIWMTPLFCANVVSGSDPSAVAMTETRPSARTPPRRRRVYSSPSMGWPDTMAVAVRSPTASKTLSR